MVAPLITKWEVKRTRSLKRSQSLTRARMVRVIPVETTSVTAVPNGVPSTGSRMILRSVVVGPKKVWTSVTMKKNYAHMEKRTKRLEKQLRNKKKGKKRNYESSDSDSSDSE
jgi:hypothetical protein